jgi:RimJ/RimL family protein N-acetyltransferase
MKPILRDIPASFDTARLIIRALRPGDGAMIHAGVVDSLQQLRLWPASLPWAQFEPSVDASEEFARTSHVDYVLRKNLAMVMLLRDSGDQVGAIGLHRIDWSVPKLEMGYWCRPRFQNTGLTSEAAAHLATFALAELGAQRLTILTETQNVASRRVAEKCGFVLEGIMRNDRRTAAGDLRDTCLYARTE